jgi:uncharacterized membrane protein HdeD (DUF308 family)
MSTQEGPPERLLSKPPSAAARLPAIARYWWLTALRGLVALLLALAIAVAGRSTARLVTFLALFWMTGGLITLRFALAIRPRPGFRLGLAAATAAVVGAALVLLRDPLSGRIDPNVFVGLLGIEPPRVQRRLGCLSRAGWLGSSSLLNAASNSAGGR